MATNRANSTIGGHGDVTFLSKSAAEWYQLGVKASEKGLFSEAEDYFEKSNQATSISEENVKSNKSRFDFRDVKLKSFFTELNETIGSSFRDSLPVEG